MRDGGGRERGMVRERERGGEIEIERGRYGEREGKEKGWQERGRDREMEREGGGK